MTTSRLEAVTAVRRWALGLCLCVAAAGCFDARSGAQAGGETHFMQACDGQCAGELACVCGVCTLACDGDDACAALGEGARCMEVDASGEACAEPGEGAGEAASVPASACASACEADRECAELGAQFVCAGGVCREAASADEPSPFASGELASQQSLVVLVVDSSGSMERKARCTCTSPACTECFPDCDAGERNRWIELVEALGGTFDDYRCERLLRTRENGATFDVGYFAPHHVPSGTPGDDGVLDLYRERLRFGLATFDNMETYRNAPEYLRRVDFDHDKSASVDGLWSYNPMRALGQPLYTEQGGLVGAVNVPGPGTEFYIDTGVRSPQAEQGALRIAGALDRLEVNDRIQRDLLVTRPYGGTPTASALDDLYYYLAHDPRAAAERASEMARHVVLITDGEPDSDYRNAGCDCAMQPAEDESSRCGAPPDDQGVYDEWWDPALKVCPYPTVEQAARVLRCGHNEICQGGPADGVHVVGLAVDNAYVRERLEQVALSGGAEGARFAADGTELRAQLAAILDEILAR